MRRRGGKVRAAAAQHGDVPVGGVDGEGHAVFFQQRGKGRVREQAVHEGHGVLAVDGAAAVGEHVLFLIRAGLFAHRGQVAAEGDVARLHLDAGARRLQGRAARVDLARVVAEDGENGRVAAGGHAVGHGLDLRDDPAARQAVDRRLLRRLQRGAAPQRLHGKVRHAVPNDEYVLHKSRAPLCPSPHSCGKLNDPRPPLSGGPLKNLSMEKSIAQPGSIAQVQERAGESAA